MHSRPYVRELVFSGLTYNELTATPHGCNLLVDEIMSAYFEGSTKIPIERMVRGYLNHVADELDKHPEYENDPDKNKYQITRVK